jgi:hypothetical protein
VCRKKVLCAECAGRCNLRVAGAVGRVTTPQRWVQMSDAASTEAPHVVGSQFPLQAGAGRGRGCRSISGRRSATGRPMACGASSPPQIALGRPWASSLVCRLHARPRRRAAVESPSSLSLPSQHADWAVWGAHTELRRSAAPPPPPPCFPLLSLSPKRLRQPQRAPHTAPLIWRLMLQPTDHCSKRTKSTTCTSPPTGHTPSIGSCIMLHAAAQHQAA